MPRQVVAIHGGTTFASHEDYLRSLTEKPVKLERLLARQMWREGLQGTLGDAYQVLLPSMPNKTNARYSEWKLWFSRIVEVLEGDCILIGHSLGGIFLAKYLSEEVLPVRVAKTILIAAPFSDESGEDLTDFKLDAISEQFTTQAGTIVCFFGTDDPVIAPSEITRYQHALPEATYHIISAPDHFMRPSFPELIEEIKSA